MNDKKCEQVIIDSAQKYLNGRPPNFKLFRGTKSYNADQIIEALKKDKEFRKWFTDSVLTVATESFIRGKH